MSRRPLVAAAVGAGVVTVGFATVGVVFIVGWAIEARDRRVSQAAILRGGIR